MDYSWGVVLSLWTVAVIALTLAEDPWNDTPPECEGVDLQAGHRCHWPDASFKCDCVPGAFCNTTTCQCIAGLTGDFCKQACPYHLDDPYTCLSYCSYSDCDMGSTCKQTNTMCHCNKGYTGPDCNLCDPSTLPDVCSPCGGITCRNEAKCDLKTDTCHCEEGYLHPPNVGDCSYCDPREHPSHCLQHCMYDCNWGKCDTKNEICRCPKSYSGHDCSFCDPEMNEGQCADSCSGRVCINEGLCDITKKECKCATGYYGPVCGFCNQTSNKQLCSKYCQHQCKYGDCDTTLEQCICSTGYVGMGCDICVPSRHPQQCLPHCPFRCVNDGYCDTTTKMCVCPPGYLGEDCSVCDPQFHLNNCTSHCPLSCINNSTCDTLSRVCECLPGWQGKACHTECSEGFFGKKCSHPCLCSGWPCDHITGECFIQTTTLITTTVLPTTEESTPPRVTNVFLPPMVTTIAEAGNNLSSTKLLETPSAIFLLALFAAVLLLLIVLSVVLYVRRHKRNQFLQPPTHEDVPLNNIVIPITGRNSVNGETRDITANTPLCDDDHLPRPLSNSFCTSVTEEGESSKLPKTKPNPRKSTNLDVDAQRFYTKEADAENFAFNRPTKQQNRNIFNEKEALTKDKLKTSNYEEPIDMNCPNTTEEQLKKEALEQDMKKDLDVSGCSPESTEAGRQKTDPGDCSDSQIEGAVGGLIPSTYSSSGKGYEQVDLDSEEGFVNSDQEAADQRNIPVYAQVDFSKKRRNMNSDLNPGYQHLQHSIEKDPVDCDPSYSKLEPSSASSLKDGYSKLDHGPKRKPTASKKTVNKSQYEQIGLGASDSSETESD